MVFIPREAQDKIQNLEKEVKKLAQENEDLKKESTELQSKPNGNWGYIFVVLFLIATALLAYNFFNPAVVGEVVTEDPQRDSLTLYLDGQITKLSQGEQGELIYRVQIGAFEDFTLEEYDINLDAVKEVTINGMEKIALGGFSRLEDAQNFQQHMVQLGLNNCYIAVYNGSDEIGKLVESEEE